MKRHFWTLVASVMFISGHGAFAAGSLKFCKRSDFIGAVQKQVNAESFQLPAMAAFDDWGKEGEIAAISDSSRRWPMIIMTLKPLEMKRGQKCATIEAAFSPLSKVQAVKPSDRRDLEFFGFVKRDGRDSDDIVPGVERMSDLVVTVATPIH